MSQEAQKQIAAWLKRNAASIQKLDPPCVSIGLAEFNEDGERGDALAVVPVPAKFSKAEIEGTALELERLALEDAQGVGGMQAYVIYPVLEDGGRGPGRGVFRVFGESGAGALMLRRKDGLEPPSARGLVQQAMRHQEANAKIAIESVGVSLRSMEREIERLTTANEIFQQRYLEMQARGMELMRLQESLLSQSQERELAMQRARARLAMGQAAWNNFAPALQALIGKLSQRFLGGSLLAGASESGTDLSLADKLKIFFESIGPAQMDGIVRLLDDKQQAMLSAIFTDIQREAGAPPAPESSNGHSKEASA